MKNYEEILNDVIEANSKIKKKFIRKDAFFAKYSSIYAFTTENINGYFNESDIKDKDILTVTSSGDHLFNAILLGAKSVDCFDINSLAKYYVCLKKAALENLNFEEFKDFFIKNDTLFKKNKKPFSIKLYKKIRENLAKDIKLFWDILFTINNDVNIRNSNLFFEETSHDEIRRFNNYMSEETFYILQEKIKNFNVNFYNCNIIDLHNIIERKYDTIYLSNIMNYIYYMFPKPIFYNYIKFIENDLSKILKDNGQIYFSYLYSCFNLSHLGKDVEYILNNKNYTQIYIDPVLYEGKDKILIYKNNK